MDQEAAMDGVESSLARLASWGGTVILTFALVASVLVDRAANPPIFPSAIEESTRQRCLRDLDRQIVDAIAQGADDEALRQLETLRHGLDMLPSRRLGAGH